MTAHDELQISPSPCTLPTPKDSLPHIDKILNKTIYRVHEKPALKYRHVLCIFEGTTRLAYNWHFIGFIRWDTSTGCFQAIFHQADVIKLLTHLILGAQLQTHDFEFTISEASERILRVLLITPPDLSETRRSDTASRIECLASFARNQDTSLAFLPTEGGVKGNSVCPAESQSLLYLQAL